MPEIDCIYTMRSSVSYKDGNWINNWSERGFFININKKIYPNEKTAEILNISLKEWKNFLISIGAIISKKDNVLYFNKQENADNFKNSIKLLDFFVELEQ